MGSFYVAIEKGATRARQCEIGVMSLRVFIPIGNDPELPVFAGWSIDIVRTVNDIPETKRMSPDTSDFTAARIL